MPERRGVSKGKSLKNLIQDEATREAVRNIEDRLADMERRLAPPEKKVFVFKEQFLETTTAAKLFLPARIAFKSRGGLVIGRIKSYPNWRAENLSTPFIRVTRAAVTFASIGFHFFKGPVTSSPTALLTSFHTDNTAFNVATAGTRSMDALIGGLWFSDVPGEGEHIYTFGIYVGQANVDVEWASLQFEIFEINPLR